jgi:hypothetical protein
MPAEHARGKLGQNDAESRAPLASGCSSGHRDGGLTTAGEFSIALEFHGETPEIGRLKVWER